VDEKLTLTSSLRSGWCPQGSWCASLPFFWSFFISYKKQCAREEFFDFFLSLSFSGLQGWGQFGILFAGTLRKEK
jgi:hypothetical protein